MLIINLTVFLILINFFFDKPFLLSEYVSRNCLERVPIEIIQLFPRFLSCFFKEKTE